MNSRPYDRIKRLADALAAALLLGVLAPLIGALWLAVRIALGAPAIFAQTRPGLEGAPFMIYKFRSMTDRRDVRGELLPDAERLTPFGQWLRRSSLDELPELWCVLVGTMSLVGPRPLLMDYLPLYSDSQRRRHDVRPGVTGWAQVNGRNALSWEEKFALDVWYVDHRSWLLDLQILLRTVQAVLLRRGISAPGEATMTRFTGNAGRPTS